MKFTREFAQHLSVEEYVHYLQIDCIEGAERLTTRVLERYALELEELRRLRDHHEEQATSLDKANTAMLDEVSNLKDTFEAVKKMYSEVDELLEQAGNKISAAKYAIQAVLI